jgi:lipoate---protein ligase
VDNKLKSKATKVMKYLDLTFDAPEENLACDEALIAWCEGEQAGGILRVWEPRQYFVVAGYSNKIGAEVNQAASVTDGIRVLRRLTGGGAVLQGPGCLNFALVFNHEDEEWRGDLSRSYRIVLERHRELFTALSGARVTVEGTSDLAVDGRKFSGNSQYRKRRWTLVHGTLLLHFDLARMERYLRMPSKEPGYRQSRPHQDFLINLNIEKGIVKQGLRRIWRAPEELGAPPPGVIDELVRERYSRPEWNLKF